ncbi:50S ribosomal protein L21 [Candidatus Uhrbacteria bacterium RIFCSPHIGHO2_12_FULL_57_11]|uniref:Large ribosomal subunit protein bL21 n=1 Tax=Candidatus Uhrbacteria bacterium RIFCSPHIGHO2_12_FULL_57_11 TaxID=1802398 RepID=A0A1F7UPU6_9BACT|nr:MAG: 50S ribosomal protein L21 [Candidatus Uhrbacteria bacterium RIFCSPHIGHO2_12_FULL_57_11]
MFAIVKTGGKQYKVAQGQTLRIEKVPVKEGELLDLDVLLIADEEGKRVEIGKPFLTGAKVTARIVSHGLGDKVHVIKYKPKVRYKRNVGHRQPYSQIKIEKLAA